jgi:hypothetical protein
MFIICASLQRRALPDDAAAHPPNRTPMKHLLPSTALPVCPFVVVAQRAQAAVRGGNGFDGAFPGAPVS